MTPGDRERLTVVEQQLADVSRELRATRAHLQFLRQLLADDRQAVDTVSGPSESTAARPVLRVIEGGRTGGRQHIPGGDRHGMRAV